MAKATHITADVHAKLEVLLIEEDDQWVAYCPALQISSYGDTQREARGAFEEAWRITLEELVKRGSLERELLRLGWRLVSVPRPIYEPPVTPRRTINELNPSRSFTERVTLPAVTA